MGEKVALLTRYPERKHSMIVCQDLAARSGDSDHSAGHLNIKLLDVVSCYYERHILYSFYRCCMVKPG